MYNAYNGKRSKNTFKFFSLSEVIPTLGTRTQFNTAMNGYADRLAKMNGVKWKISDI